MTGPQARRWEEVLDALVRLFPPGPARVLVDGTGDRPHLLATHLAAALRNSGTGEGITLAEGAGPGAGPGPGAGAGAGDVVVWVRSAPRGGGSRADGEGGADVVVDLHDPGWPVIRRVAPRLGGHDRWYISESRAFFAPRAATWDTKFGDDMPAYAAAIAEAGIRRDGVVIDAGCGTGRAIPALREAVGPCGVVIGLDLTPEMLARARAEGRAEEAGLVIADARRLPLAGASVDAVFAAGLIMHLPDTDAGLRELARVTRPGGVLAIFHPTGRAALAARHGRALRPDEPLAEAPLRRSAELTGWRLTGYDDPPHRFLAIAARR
ncbi:class I SAM-dependent methyltransferase [Sphaerisporangium corydalis]|uniref:Class I SAM-dependent methyltransferase n=1 Tax=Sphaerisporangium corydalis TaxID=1441875 RepID=A0ABV9EFR5_9ACTN|nr:class I SAM-dependent methyltransferase [Sphaerisporangium corydalis]